MEVSKIYIVHNSSETCNKLESIIQDHFNIEVETFENPFSAINGLLKDIPDVCFIGLRYDDYDIDGFEIASHLKVRAKAKNHICYLVQISEEPEYRRIFDSRVVISKADVKIPEIIRNIQNGRFKRIEENEIINILENYVIGQRKQLEFLETALNIFDVVEQKEGIGSFYNELGKVIGLDYNATWEKLNRISIKNKKNRKLGLGKKVETLEFLILLRDKILNDK